MAGVGATGLWRAPHLPLFLLASLWAGLVPLVWLAPGLVCDPLAWHRQELPLGAAGAAMGGYLLSALPHWLKQTGRETGTVTCGPAATRLLVLAWVLGRVLDGPCMPDALALVGLGLFPLGLVACLVVPLTRAGAWRRLPIALAPLLLLLIALRLRLASDSLSAVLGMTLLVALVGGRIIPAFLRSRAGFDTAGREPRSAGARLADLALGLALAAHLAGAGPGWSGALLLVAALGQGLRLAGWPLIRGLRGGQSDLVVLVMAWAWMPMGLALVGAAQLDLAGPPLSDALHALTMGLMGSTLLAVMARAWMRRVPGALRLGPALGLAFALVQLATLLRLALPLAPAPAALCWCAAWAIATIASVRALFRPVPHPVLSARRLPPSHAQAHDPADQRTPRP